MKRTIEINDVLQDQVDSAIEDVRQCLLDYLKENDCSELPDLGNDLDYDGSIHQIVDSAVPIYTYDIKCAWFLYENELTEAYENAGVGDDAHEGDGMTAIFFYIDQAVREWYDANAEDVFDEWRMEQDEKAEEQAEAAEQETKDEVAQ